VIDFGLARFCDEPSIDDSRVVSGTPDYLAPELVWGDFRNSLFAAYTVEEVRDQVAAAGVAEMSVEMVSDRHLAVWWFLKE
jgi:serine/threonine protein kinase